MPQSPLSQKRRAISHLIDERSPTDALNVYFSQHHPDNKTKLFTMPASTQQASGFITLSQTSIDLFRSVMTMRLPQHPTDGLDLEASAHFIRNTLSPGQPVIIHTKASYYPLLQALFDIQSEQNLKLFRFDPHQFTPIVNVFVTKSLGVNGLPRFTIRNPAHDPNGEILASAGINWQTPYFADIAIHTKPPYFRQGYGRSVLNALVQYLLKEQRTPLYSVNLSNAPSIHLAQNNNFFDTRSQMILLEASCQT